MKLAIGFAVLAVLLLRCGANGANIMGIFVPPSKSHHILGETLMRGFAKRGHNVTLVSGFKVTERIQNFRHIHIDTMVQPFEKFKFEMRNFNQWKMMAIMGELVEMINTIPLEHPRIRELRESGEKYDVVVIDDFMNDPIRGLAHELGAHIVPLSPSHSLIVNHITGNVAPYSFVPALTSSYTDRMTFAERVLNTLMSTVWMATKPLIMKPLQNKIYRKYFPDGPELDEIEKNISLVLVNTHLSTESPRPYVPNMIQIGGYHVGDAKPLPQDLQKFMDDAKEGVIYCSLGSNIKTAIIPKETVLAFIRSFAKFPQKVLWKWDDDSLPENPKNVKISKWFPQRDVLAHPNVKLFITHGGLLSTTEAIAVGVPMIGIPFLADQQLNVKTIESGGFGRGLEFESITENTLTDTIKELIDNPKYRVEVKKRQTISMDRPMKPMDTAIYWVEYLIRHNGAKHLRCAGADLNFYQYWLLDVFALFFVTIFVFYKAMRWTCGKCCGMCRKKVYKQEYKRKRE